MLTLSHRQRRASLRRKHVFGFKSEFWKFDHMICTISLKLGQPEFAVIVIEKNFLKSKKCVNSSGREYLTPNVANFVETYDEIAHSLRFSKSELSTQKDRKPSII